ncbi:MAG: ribulose-phosphate 3-epimerase [Agathobacter sp.]|nr:ribulose-phosphate 3-epimerase [Agathobacter sp.]
MNILSPSILAADFSILGEQVKLADKAGAQYLHIDIMDGCFVQELSIGTPVVSSLRKCSEIVFDVHLMVNEPVRYIKTFSDAGADIITVHCEACKDLNATIDEIHNHNKLAGVALNPDTPVSRIMDIINKVDMVLVMLVVPGKGGQKMIPETVDKVREIKEYIDKNNLDIKIEVDGGVKLDNVNEVLDAGANVIVAGSAVFNGNIEENVIAFLDKLNS